MSFYLAPIAGGREKRNTSLEVGSCILSRALETMTLFFLRADIRHEEEEWWGVGK